MTTQTRRTIPVAADLRIDNVTVIDPLEGTRARGRSILIRGGRIASVAPTSSVDTASAVRAIDGTGRYATPGYNDMHSHALQAGNPELAFATMLAEGVTGMRQMEGSTAMLRRRAEHDVGLTEHAPRLLQMPGELLLPFNARSVDGVREIIARQREAGADFIKMIMTTRDVFFAAVTAAHDNGMRIAGHLPPSVTPEEAAAAGFDCIEHTGTSTNVFLSCSVDAEQLWQRQDRALPVPSWITGLPHAGEIFTALAKNRVTGPASNTTSKAQLALLERAFAGYSEQAVRRLGDTFVACQTWHCPTLIGTRSKYVIDDPEYRADPWLRRLPAKERRRTLRNIRAFTSLPAEQLAVYHDYYARTVETVGIWHATGVPILAGADSAGRGVARSLQLEFRELSRAGLSPLDILRATTTAPAAYLGRGERMGRIAAGMDADLLLLDADPLASVSNLDTVSLVVRDGHEFTKAELSARIEELVHAATTTRGAAGGRRGGRAGAGAST